MVHLTGKMEDVIGPFFEKSFRDAAEKAIKSDVAAYEVRLREEVKNSLKDASCQVARIVGAEGNQIIVTVNGKALS